MIYIIGHKKPDLDSAASAVSLKYFFDHQTCWNKKNSQAVLASPANFETKTIFKKFKIALPLILKPNKIKKIDEFILVDHNEPLQRLEGIKNKQITDIFDHHKINLSLKKPISLIIMPWGATVTVVWWLMKKVAKIKPPKNLASLMISAILSDTSGLKSSTTTNSDKQAIKELNKIAKISSLNQLIKEIFAAKSYLGNLTNRQIISKDYKIYQFGKKKVFINQLETVFQDNIIKKTPVFAKELKLLKKRLKLNHAYFLITDILKINTKCLVLKEDKGLFLKAFPAAKTITKNIYDLGSLMSRKKEIAPAIEKAINP